MNTQDNVSVPAAMAAGGKLRLSEIVRSLRAHEVELDCKAVVLSVDEDGVTAAFDVDQVQANNRVDLGLLNLFVGMQALVSEHLSYEPEAHAAVAAAYARGRRMAVLKQFVEGDSEDGKEVCHE